ncbi:tetratricopeptide repeat protein [Clostridium sp. YIM B02555]|uniref:tetratricopeptide repeat protein n=1 Tax=Clostridium sp. YIM B02555 TaxID=2911968 RepID=UPI001EEEE2E7|nr:tetratricopeptide repeat protein [Clostridium sp. YIM B02555]
MIFWWDVLGIKQDSDFKTIEYAYEKLLREYNPKKDIVGYRRLREAYDEGIKYAKKNNININETESIIGEVSSDFNIIDGYLNEQVKIFLERLKTIYKDITLRINSAEWDKLLNSDILRNAEVSLILEDKVFEFLLDHKYLPAEILTKLNNIFSWSQNRVKLYDKYSKEYVNELLHRLKEPNNLKYDYIGTIDPVIADEYLYEREMAYEALEMQDYGEAHDCLNEAYDLFSDDAELLRLMGDCYYISENHVKALMLYKSAFEMNNKDMHSALRIGIILVLDKNFSTAMPYLKTFLSCNKNDKLALDYTAFCYYYSDDLVKAKEYFTRVLSFDENNEIVKEYIKNIEAQLHGEQVKKIKFNKNNLIEEAVVKKEIKIKKIVDKRFERKESKASRNYRITIAIIIAISLGVLRYALYCFLK